MKSGHFIDLYILHLGDALGDYGALCCLPSGGYCLFGHCCDFLPYFPLIPLSSSAYLSLRLFLISFGVLGCKMYNTIVCQLALARMKS